jgi:hypothetical protein
MRHILFLWETSGKNPAANFHSVHSCILLELAPVPNLLYLPYKMSWRDSYIDIGQLFLHSIQILRNRKNFHSNWRQGRSWVSEKHAVDSTGPLASISRLIKHEWKQQNIWTVNQRSRPSFYYKSTFNKPFALCPAAAGSIPTTHDHAHKHACIAQEKRTQSKCHNGARSETFSPLPSPRVSGETTAGITSDCCCWRRRYYGWGEHAGSKKFVQGKRSSCNSAQTVRGSFLLGRVFVLLWVQCGVGIYTNGAMSHGYMLAINARFATGSEIIRKWILFWCLLI